MSHSYEEAPLNRAMQLGKTVACCACIVPSVELEHFENRIVVRTLYGGGGGIFTGHGNPETLVDWEAVQGTNAHNSLL